MRAGTSALESQSRPGLGRLRQRRRREVDLDGHADRRRRLGITTDDVRHQARAFVEVDVGEHVGAGLAKARHVAVLVRNGERVDVPRPLKRRSARSPDERQLRADRARAVLHALPQLAAALQHELVPAASLPVARVSQLAPGVGRMRSPCKGRIASAGVRSQCAPRRAPASRRCAWCPGCRRCRAPVAISRVRRPGARRTRRAAAAPPRSPGRCRACPGDWRTARRRRDSPAARLRAAMRPPSTKAPPSPGLQNPRFSRVTSTVIVNES